MARVMICDDAAFIRMALARILKAHDHTIVCEAADGEEAVAKFKQFKPEVVMMDITMNGMDGIEATRQILEIDPLACVIIVSSMGQQNKVVEAINAGAKDFVVKPFEPDRVMKVIDKNFGSVEEMY